MGLSGGSEISADTGQHAVVDWEALRAQGIECARSGELEKALEYLTRSLEQYRTAGGGDETALLYAEVGEVELELGHLGEAAGHFKRALGINQERRDWLGLARAHRRLGMVFLEKSDFARAEESLREAAQALESQADEREEALLQVTWGVLFDDRGSHTKAREAFRQALAKFQRLHDTSGEITTRRHLASSLHELGSSEEAEQELHIATSLLAQEGDVDRPELIEIKNLLGGILEDQGQITAALKLFEEAYELADGLGITPARVECLRRMGSARAVRGEFTEASDHYRQAIDICKKLDDRKALSVLYGDLGDVCIAQGEHKEAVNVLKEAERLDHDDPLGFALAKRRLGSAYQEKGEYKRAEEYYAEAETLLGDIDDDGERAVLYVAWGSLAQERGRVSESLERYRRALEINEAQRNSFGEAICRRHIGSALHDLGRLDEAAEELQRARAILERHGSEDKPELIQIANHLGAVFEDLGRIADALDLFREAYGHAERLGIGPAMVECLRCRGSALAASGSLTEAKIRYREAIERCEEMSDEVALSTLYRELGDVLAEEGRMSDAIDSYKEALALDQDHSDLPGLALANRRLGSAYQRIGDLARAHDLFADAERLLSRLEDVDEQALLLLHKGSLLEDEGKHLEALQEYGRACSKYEEQRSELGVATAVRHEGSAQLRLGRLGDAEASVEAALATVEPSEDKPELVACVNLLGRVRQAQGRPEEAVELHSRALETAERIDLRLASANSLRGLGNALAASGGSENLKAAKARLDRALSICNDLTDKVACAELHDDIGDVQLASGEVKSAEDHYERGLGIARRLDRSTLTADILLGLARCNRRTGKLDSVRVRLAEARAIVDSIDDSSRRQARLWLELAQIDAEEGKHEAAVDGLEKALAAFLECNDKAGARECHQHLLNAYARSGDLERAGLHLSEGLMLEGNLRALWSVMLGHLHPKINHVAATSFSEGRYSSGVFEAMSFCEHELRARAGLPAGASMSGVTAKAFDEEHRGGRAPWTEPEHMSAFAAMCGQAFGACRNPLAHTGLEMTESQAFAWLGVAHLMLTLADAEEA